MDTPVTNATHPLVKARLMPNSATNLSGDFVAEFFLGAESYPYLMGLNIKHFFICRVGMMLWPLVGLLDISR